MIFEFIRKLTVPFDQIERYVPKKGRILDVGCGHGFFAAQLAKNPGRQVLGIDPSSYKIQLAKTRHGHLPHLKFKATYLKSLKSKKYDCIAIIDVLYLLPEDEKLKILAKTHQLLKKNGVFILKEVNTKPDWMFKLIKLEEALMVRLLRYTHSDYRRLYFLDKQALKKLLRKTGFKIITERQLRGILPYPHLLFVSQKTGTRYNTIDEIH